MGKVALKALDYPASPDGYSYYDMITFGGGSAGPKPQPPGGGTEPPLGIWGPNDPRPSLPIAGWNPDGSWGPPGGGGGGGSAPPGKPVYIVPMPPQDPPVAPPAGLPEGSVQVLVIIPGERYPAVGWMQPYPSTGPVEPPPA